MLTSFQTIGEHLEAGTFVNQTFERRVLKSKTVTEPDVDTTNASEAEATDASSGPARERTVTPMSRAPIEAKKVVDDDDV